MNVAVIGGDGIGPEVMEVAAAVLEAVAARYRIPLVLDRWNLGAERYLDEGVAITDAERDRLVADYDAALLGALGDARVPDNRHAREILLGLRFHADLFINFRPCRLYLPALSPLRDPDPATDIVFFRENTEDLYTGSGGSLRTGTPDEVATEISLNTYRGVERIVHAAFAYADRIGRGRVTLVDKANALLYQGSLWRRVFAEVGAGFPGIAQDTMYVDAMAMDLVRRPQRYEVVVTSNLFGDILSDLGAQVTGGLGMAPSGNLHPGSWALFEPVHGSAPDIAGRGIANPLAAVGCVALLLDYLEEPQAAVAVERCMADSIRAGITTPDLGGASGTRALGDWMVQALCNEHTEEIQR